MPLAHGFLGVVNQSATILVVLGRHPASRRCLNLLPHLSPCLRPGDIEGNSIAVLPQYRTRRRTSPRLGQRQHRRSCHGKGRCSPALLPR
eukprot:237977-Chlamydomonas_euryale.AAC.1